MELITPAMRDRKERRKRAAGEDPVWAQLADLAAEQELVESDAASDEDASDGGLLDEARAELRALHEEELDVLAAPPPPPPPLHPVVEGPAEPRVREDDRGNIFAVGRARPIGKISTFGTSVSARCSIPGHNRCTRAYGFTKMPAGHTLVDWLADGLDLPDERAHTGLPKPSR